MIFSCFDRKLREVALQPPTLYSIMEMIANQSGVVKTTQLAEYSRSSIFDFSYPLSDKVDKEDFEIKILNHYITRRIGFESFALFKIQLACKLAEIMPKYNLMFNSLDGWNLFKGMSLERTYKEINKTDRTIGIAGKTVNSVDTTTNNTIEDTSTSDRRFSDTPQNRLTDIKDGSYVTNYNFDTVEDSTIGNTTSNTDGTTENKQDTNDKLDGSKEISEKTITERDNESEILIDFMKNYTNIMSMIYTELDDLFYCLL